jgi:hypothetical protein
MSIVMGIFTFMSIPWVWGVEDFFFWLGDEIAIAYAV